MNTEHKTPILLIDENSIKDKIYSIRGTQVMLDYDLASLYGYETKAFNRQVTNNIDKFPTDMMFRLTKEEVDSILKCKNYTSSWGGSRYLPRAFTEQGIYMLMTVLKGDIATQQSISLVRAFKRMRDYLTENEMVIRRLNRIETKQLEADEKFEQIFKQLESQKTNKAVIFFKGQLWDATNCIEELIGEAKESITLIDGYVDRKTLAMLSRKKNGIPLSIYSSIKNCKLSEKEMDDFNSQYGPLNLSFTEEFHDRFLILDNRILYHIGASIKDAGKKAFEISITEDDSILKSILMKLNQS